LSAWLARGLHRHGLRVDVIDARQAHGVLTVVRRAHRLKDWARGIEKRTSHKRACVALARKLAVVLHRMLITGQEFRWPPKHETAAA